MSTISAPHARHGTQTRHRRPVRCGDCRRHVHQIIDSIEPLDPADTDVVEVSSTCIERDSFYASAATVPPGRPAPEPQRNRTRCSAARRRVHPLRRTDEDPRRRPAEHLRADTHGQAVSGPAGGLFADESSALRLRLPNRDPPGRRHRRPPDRIVDDSTGYAQRGRQRGTMS